MTNLSPNFTAQEFTRTEQRGMLEGNYAAFVGSPQAQKAAAALCNNILENIRMRFGPVILHSGYRCPALNAVVGGQPGSQHMLGEAADFHVLGHGDPDGLRLVFDWIRYRSALPFGQVILEGFPARWIHVSLGEPWRDPRKCRQALLALPNGAGGFRYEPA